MANGCDWDYGYASTDFTGNTSYDYSGTAGYDTNYDYSNVGTSCDVTSYTQYGTPTTSYGGGTTGTSQDPTAGSAAGACGASDYTGSSGQVTGSGGAYGGTSTGCTSDTTGKSVSSLAGALGGGLLSAFLGGTSKQAQQSAGGTKTGTYTPTYADWAQNIIPLNIDYARMLESTGTQMATQQPTDAQQQLYGKAQQALLSPGVCGQQDYMTAGMSPQEAAIANLYMNQINDQGGMGSAINTAQQGYNTMANVYNQNPQQLQQYIANNVAGVGNLLGRSGVADQQTLQAIQNFQYQNAQNLANQGNVVAGYQAQVPALQGQEATALSPMLQTPQNMASQQAILDYLNQWQQKQVQAGTSVSNQGANLLSTLINQGTGNATMNQYTPTNVPSLWSYIAGGSADTAAKSTPSLVNLITGS